MEKITLAVSQITPGMKLAEPITNANGTTLMPSGIRLTPMFIARIKKWNIERLAVLVEKQGEEQASGQEAEQNGVGPLAAEAEDSPNDGDDGDEPALTEEQVEFARGVAAEISARFVNVRDDPLMMQLRAVVIKRLVLHGPDGVVNALRRRPGLPPLPNGGIP